MQVVEQVLDSREVAEMVDKEHKYLMRDIRMYSTDMTSAKISPVDFWSESTYKDSKGEERPCYLVTKKGCEFIAHKIPGKKGTIFTARYINRFHEMEEQLQKANHMDWFVNDIRVFQHREFGILRTLKLDGKDYFIGKDATTSLGYVNSTDTLKKRVSNSEKCYVGICDGNRTRKMVAITQKGLEEMIRTGQLPLAGKYNEWIQGQVLPALCGKQSSEIVQSMEASMTMNKKDVITGSVAQKKESAYIPRIDNPLRVLKTLWTVAERAGLKVQSAPLKACDSILNDRVITIRTDLTVEKVCFELAFELAHVFIHYDNGNLIDSPLQKDYMRQAERAAAMMLHILTI